ncbi:arachidonate 5-lipoxygenase-like [Rhinatrema bivittatum]|uniref:arachidonate 5-lipoxygenase-like n=1 Tax=Rhinatrema bivittatum TaxID=194408 RepID=UPI001126C5A2|nr:arachidonate 5-lipoxygenase-like [Rhinatrema bivittatum]
MPKYSVTVATGSQWLAGTDGDIYITLEGSRGCSEKSPLSITLYDNFERGAIDTYNVIAKEDLGEIYLVKIEKHKICFEDDWYCKYITVKAPCGKCMEFPCYKWITSKEEFVLRDGRAKLLQDDKIQILKEYRQKELEARQKLYRWKEWQPGFLLSIDANSHSELPREVQFDGKKLYDFDLNYIRAIENLSLNIFVNMFQSSWSNFEDFERIFIRISSSGSEYVRQHWQEDSLFGYQFLNGCNPVLIKKCKEIPQKFPVTTEMVESSLKRNLTLEEEAQQGNIFIADYELLNGIPANATDPSTVQYLAAPICLLYKNTENEILPIAIQINQQPGPDNPIFLPTDENYDWLLAKIWVRSSDFQIHQTVTHLLCTHLISEVFGIAMYRQLPEVHPLYKLLVPHVRFTIAINTKAREQLIGKNGIFDKANGTGGGGHVKMVVRALEKFTYDSLCFPKAIKLNGMESKEDIPYYFYRDDGIKVWEAVKNFVTDVVNIYYKSDEVVCEDTELQAFVKEVFIFGLRGNKATGFPENLKTTEKLIEYLTLVIFTASAQHASVNFGQFDWYSWIPNAPPTMRQPPPKKKGTVTEKYIMESLPDRGRSCWHLGAVWALSRFQDNELFLGMYPDEHFTEKPVKEAMQTFRKNLSDICSFIQDRNKNKKSPYYYFSPDRIPNSVAT